ncbi:MAG: ATP-binding protein [Ruminococcaceae bacterium]|nr:ATP-binding protein [Oscillospiraceae bacterium]
MIKLIVGSRGSGKTKQLVDMINKAVETSSGNIVCIEKGMQLTYDLDHRCRLVDMDEYNIKGCERFYGFVAGLLAGNYDIQGLYIDGILKVLDGKLENLGILLEHLDKLAGEQVDFVVTVSADAGALPESVKKYAG